MKGQGYPWSTLPAYESEFRFHPKRRWRFDYCWPAYKIAVEIEGGLWIPGRTGRGGAHSLPTNILRDMEKQNAAGLLGWRIFRFTPRQFRTGEALRFMMDVFA